MQLSSGKQGMRVLSKGNNKGFSKTAYSLRTSNYSSYYFAIALAYKVLYNDINNLSSDLLNG